MDKSIALSRANVILELQIRDKRVRIFNTILKKAQIRLVSCLYSMRSTTNRTNNAKLFLIMAYGTHVYQTESYHKNRFKHKINECSLQVSIHSMIIRLLSI